VMLQLAGTQVYALNKGSTSDPGMWINIGCPVQRQPVLDIYNRDHNRYYLLIVTLSA
jgi:hypothetical protein